jgi:hypothetical protein
MSITVFEHLPLHFHLWQCFARQAVLLVPKSDNYAKPLYQYVVGTTIFVLCPTKSHWDSGAGFRGMQRTDGLSVHEQEYQNTRVYHSVDVSLLIGHSETAHSVSPQRVYLREHPEFCGQVVFLWVEVLLVKSV